MAATDDPVDHLVVDNANLTRYELHVDGVLVSLADYTRRDDVLVLPHVFTVPERRAVAARGGRHRARPSAASWPRAPSAPARMTSGCGAGGRKFSMGSPGAQPGGGPLVGRRRCACRRRSAGARGSLAAQSSRMGAAASNS